MTPNFAPVALLRFTLSFAIAGHCATAQEPEKRPAEEVQDNSFLIEEAYNQEPGVVQHILSITHQVTRMAGPDEHEWQFVFTQEWPAFAPRFSLILPDGQRGQWLWR